MDAAYRRWAVEFASALMRRPVEFWYDQFLAKPPEKSAPTLWHQDEGYWGRNLDGRGITCWMPMHDVDPNERVHAFHRRWSSSSACWRTASPTMCRVICCIASPTRQQRSPVPLPLGGVTFHHGKTPHMTPANQSDRWRRALTQHLRVEGTAGEGDHYPWKVYVNQMTGERTTPETR